MLVMRKYQIQLRNKLRRIVKHDDYYHLMRDIGRKERKGGKEGAATIITKKNTKIRFSLILPLLHNLKCICKCMDLSLINVNPDSSRKFLISLSITFHVHLSVEHSFSPSNHIHSSITISDYFQSP